ncbi:MAG: glycosyltransferase family 4 protein [Candidatus Micrarchaeota archaeon]
MKILLISDFSYPLQGGTERHVMGLAEYASAKGHKVHVLTPNWKGKKNWSYSKKCLTIHLIYLPLMRNFFIRSLAYFFAGLWISKREKIDAIHSFYTMPAIISASLISALEGLPHMITLFEWELLDWQRASRLKWPLVRWAFESSSRITTLSWILERKVSRLFPSRKVTTITNWLDDTLFQIAPRPKPQSGKGRILFAGRLSEDKGIYVLFDALARLKGLDYQLSIAGPPIELQKAKNEARRLCIADKVKFLGFVGEGELPKLYRNCDILVLPSIRREGMGFVIIEAMAQGKPVVGSDDGGIPDAIGDGGIVVKKGDSARLANAIKTLLTNQKKYRHYSDKALSRVKRLFTRDAVISKYLALYGEMAGNEKKQVQE